MLSFNHGVGEPPPDRPLPPEGVDAATCELVEAGLVELVELVAVVLAATVTGVRAVAEAVAKQRW